MRFSTLLLVIGAVLSAVAYYLAMREFGDIDRAVIMASVMGALPIVFGLLEREQENRAASAVAVTKWEAAEEAHRTEIVVYSLDTETMSDKTVIVMRDFEWYGHTTDEQVVALYRALQGRLGANTPTRWTAYCRDTLFCTSKDLRAAIARGF